MHYIKHARVIWVNILAGSLYDMLKEGSPVLCSCYIIRNQRLLVFAVNKLLSVAISISRVILRL